jgi:hypothetical protein
MLLLAHVGTGLFLQRKAIWGALLLLYDGAFGPLRAHREFSGCLGKDLLLADTHIHRDGIGRSVVFG